MVNYPSARLKFTMDKGRKAFYWDFLEDEVEPHGELPDQEGSQAVLPAGGTVCWLPTSVTM